MERRKRLRLDEVVEMVQTDDTVEEPMDEGSDDEFPDVTEDYMEPDVQARNDDVQDPACACKYCYYS